MRNLLPVIFVCISLFSCTKEEGENGNSVITGKVYTKVYNNSFTHILREYYKPEADVYIIYGDNEVYNDHIKTNWDGSYRFEYLGKGDYKIFVYSLDTLGLSPAGISTVSVELNITGNNKTVTPDDLVVVDKCDYNDGYASITGKIYIYDFNAERLTLIQEYYGPDEDVYIVYADDPFYFDHVKTYYDGTFKFENLVKGSYTIYALSNDMVNKQSRQLVPVSKTVTIDSNYQKLDIGDINVVR